MLELQLPEGDAEGSGCALRRFAGAEHAEGLLSAFSLPKSCSCSLPALGVKWAAGLPGGLVHQCRTRLKPLPSSSSCSVVLGRIGTLPPALPSIFPCERSRGEVPGPRLSLANPFCLLQLPFCMILQNVPIPQILT